jgi:hypothetical protein
MAVCQDQLCQAQQQRAWVPQGIETLQRSASSKTNFTFDHSMLVFASKLEPNNEELRRVIAGVSGISVHTCHFPEAWQYDAETLSSVKEDYRAAGWTQLMNKHAKGGDAGGTDLWVRLENNTISNVAILLAAPNDVTFVGVSGSISPLDLSHLGGHFGIPKIEGGVVMPQIQRNTEIDQPTGSR